jgi:hypothetical protein
MIRDLTTSAKTPFIQVEHLCVWSVQPEFSSSTQRGSSNGHFSPETLPSKEIAKETCISIGWVARPLVNKSYWSRQGEGGNLIVKETQACFNLLHVTNHKGLPMDVWYRNAGQTHNTNTSRNANERYHSSTYIFSTCNDLHAEKTMTKL